MLAQQRHLEIQRILERQGGVRVVELAAKFEVTEETVRRDLARMEEDGLLERTHGGAIPLPSMNQASPYSVRAIEQVQEKRSAARVAVREIEEGDTIFLDGSTTVHELARIFPDIPCTVLTNSQPILGELSSRTRVEILSTGGTYDRRSNTFIGPLAEQMIRSLQLDKVFMGCKGLDFKRGLSDASVRHMNLKRSIIQWADQVFILADHSKFDERSRFFFASLQEINGVITDKGVDPKHRQTLRNLGVKVYTE